MSGVASRREGARLVVTDPAGNPVVAVEPNEWETRFFARPIGRLLVYPEPARALPLPGWQQAVALAAAEADAYRLVQVHVEVGFLSLVPALEEAGFRLVDTRISFLTRLDRRSLPRYEPPVGLVRSASPDDLPDLLDLARRRLTENPGFHSRYKDNRYFTAQESARWFAAWVENDLADPDGRLFLWQVDGRLQGFFGCQRQIDREAVPFYKSTLAAVEEAHRGLKAHLFLQTAIFESLPTDEFWMQNTTQLANAPVIHNHVLGGRHIDRVELTFFRAPQA